MMLKTQLLLLFCLITHSFTDARRVRVRPTAQTEENEEEEQQQQVQYYTQPRARAEPEQQLVVIADEDPYNGLYGRAVERSGAATYQRPLARTASVDAQSPRQARLKEQTKEPPVQTIKNYSNVNDDGSFTFGYEAADGSFKEETRGTDCVVRGKYGYVDPDGNKREFTYVSGNPCDPNAPKEEEEADEAIGENENVPQNIPNLRPRPRPVRPTPAPRPTTTLFQQSYNSAGTQQASADESDEEQQVYVAPQRVRQQPAARIRPQVVRVTPRPSAPVSTLPATTYRPQLLVSVTPRPNSIYSNSPRPSPTPATVTSSTYGNINFDEELKRFRLGSTPAPPRPGASPTTTARSPTGQPIYTSELVYDPSSGQYNTVVYQQLPKSTGEINIKNRQPQLPQYVPQPQPQPQQNVLLRPQSPNLLQQQLYQQQQQQQFQQSQGLYAHQRQQQLQQLNNQHRFQPYDFPSNVQLQHPSTLAPAATKPISVTSQPSQQQRLISRPSNPQQYYYFAPETDGQSYAAGQIDAFLRGHNIPL